MSLGLVRHVALFVLSRLNPGDVHIEHHWTGERLTLHSFRHRNYWFRGTRRERETMLAIMRLVAPGDVVYDVGGHIGYMTVLFAHLGASVHVFEPGPNNIEYLRANAGQMPGVVIVQCAVGSQVGRADLFVEDLTGQNNSLAGDFQFRANQKNARGVSANSYTTSVPVTTLDEYAAHHAVPTLVKLDIEGYEWEALSGALGVLRDHKPAVIAELTHNIRQFNAVMGELGYVLRDERFAPLKEGPLLVEGTHRNVVFLHPDRHARLLRGSGTMSRVVG
jgi:FkbM family methyltransferase